MSGDPLGSVAALGRFPVKSMRGESPREVAIGPQGVVGDRAWALRDAHDGRILSAKRSAALLGFGARYAAGLERPPTITLPDGRTIAADDPEAGAVLSRALEREVRVVGPDDASEDRRIEYDETNTWDAPPGAFLDLAPIHLLTTASLRAAGAAYPEGRFDPRRFRPSIFVDCGTRADFAEDALVDHVVAVGDTVRLRIFLPTIRCVMTTHAQEDLPKDPAILRTLADRHEANLGVYATVETPGTVRIGDPVHLV